MQSAEAEEEEEEEEEDEESQGLYEVSPSGVGRGAGWLSFIISMQDQSPSLTHINSCVFLCVNMCAFFLFLPLWASMNMCAHV